jgi:hypothetical protein
MEELAGEAERALIESRCRFDVIDRQHEVVDVVG